MNRGVWCKVIFCGLFLMFLGISPAPAVQAERISAQALIHDSQGRAVGRVLFTEEENGVKIKVRVDALPSGTYAFHIHENGQCAAPDFKTAGGHFNPFASQHGFLNREGPHAGDLPNIDVGKSGVGTLTVTTDRLTLKKGRINSLLKDGGTAVIFHEHPDDYISDPAGACGARMACGMIEEVHDTSMMDDMTEGARE